MNEQDVLNHLESRIPFTFAAHGASGGESEVAIRELFGATGILDIGQRILEVLSHLVGTVGLDVETVVAATKSYFDDFVAGDNPRIPNLLETMLEQWAWMAIEASIRQMFERSV